MSELNRPTTAELEDLGFCLGQAFTWLARCRRIGVEGMRSEDPGAVERMELAIANGIARVYARMDLIGHHAEFSLALDGLEEPIELFSQGFKPAEPMN